MTRFELFESYTSIQKKDTWKSLGSLEINETTTTYMKDAIYRVATVASPILGSLVYCNETFSGAIDFVSASRTGSDVYFSTNIISPYFKYVMDEADLTPILADPITLGFIPFDQFNNQLGEIYISDQELETILLEVGVPFIAFEELEYSKQQIANLMIKPALQEYFKWFPKTVQIGYPLNTTRSFKIQFPTEAYQVVQAAITQSRMGSSANGTIGNPLLRYYDEMMFSAANPMMGNSSRAPSSRGLLNDWGSMLMEKAARQAIMNTGTRIHFDVVKENGIRYLTGYANKQGTLNVAWAYKTEDIDDVEFARMPEFRKFAAAKVLRALGALRSQGKLPDNSTMYDYKEFATRASELEKEVLEDWRGLTKFSGIIRGSH